MRSTVVWAPLMTQIALFSASVAPARMWARPPTPRIVRSSCVQMAVSPVVGAGVDLDDVAVAGTRAASLGRARLRPGPRAGPILGAAALRSIGSAHVVSAAAIEMVRAAQRMPR